MLAQLIVKSNDNLLAEANKVDTDSKAPSIHLKGILVGNGAIATGKQLNLARKQTAWFLCWSLQKKSSSSCLH
jgi:hypothetical protein